MVHCVVVNCNSKTGCGESFFKFPDKLKEKDLYNTWIVKIRRSQSNTHCSKKLWEPSKHSHVCSKHFSFDSFTKDPSLLQSINFTAKGLLLKKDSFPTLSLGVEPLLGPDRPRGGFRKRERQRVLQDIFSNFEDGRKVRKANQDTEASYDYPLYETSTTNNSVIIDQVAVGPPQSSTCSVLPDVALQRCAKTYVKSTQTLRGVVSQGCQTSSSFIKYADAATQTEELPQNPVVIQKIVSQVSSSTASEDEYSTDDEFNDNQDGDWFPTDDESDDSDSVLSEINITDILNTDKIEERKYIVFESNLKELLEVCRECHNKCVVVLKQNVGSMVVMEATCEAGHTFLWSSQPSNNQLPLGNLLLSASILFSGASVTNILNVLNRINVSSFTDRTYRHIQSCYLVPAVKNVWSLWQMAAVREVEGRNVKLGGDARCCSPGHTAKYGSYSLMDLESGIVLDVQLIQVTEVNNSYAMEKEGLIRGLAALKEKGVQATDLTTDRHCSVRKHMRTMEPDINHWFDVWHVAKGVYKKLILLSKKKGCEQIEEWAQSISNHLYWAAASSNGNGDLVEAKWKSITNHVANLHDGHGELYQRCQHEHLDRHWIKKGSKAHKLLKECLLKKGFLKDIQKLSPAEQTSKLEAYHKVVCQFAPKFLHFFYDAMHARLLLAAMHNNENCVRQQATKRDGTEKWKIAYPKAKHGDHTLKPVLDSCSYGYVKDLLQEVVELREAFPSYKAAQVLVSRDAPPPTTLKSAIRVELNVAITRHHSRFNTT